MKTEPRVRSEPACSAFVFFREGRAVYLLGFKGFKASGVTVSTADQGIEQFGGYIRKMRELPQATVSLDGRPYTMMVSKRRMKPGVRQLLSRRAKDLSAQELLILAEHKMRRKL